MNTLDRIPVEVRIGAPSNRMYYGAENKTLCVHRLTIPLTPPVFANLLKGGIWIEGMYLRIFEYDLPTNILLMSGHLTDVNTAAKIQELQLQGWQFDREACMHHKIELVW